MSATIHDFTKARDAKASAVVATKKAARRDRVKRGAALAGRVGGTVGRGVVFASRAVLHVVLLVLRGPLKVLSALGVTASLLAAPACWLLLVDSPHRIAAVAACLIGCVMLAVFHASYDRLVRSLDPNTGHDAAPELATDAAR